MDEYSEALRTLFNYLEKRHHEYCRDDENCTYCKAMKTVAEHNPITFEQELKDIYGDN